MVVKKMSVELALIAHVPTKTLKTDFKMCIKKIMEEFKQREHTKQQDRVHEPMLYDIFSGSFFFFNFFFFIASVQYNRPHSSGVHFGQIKERPTFQ